jgi:hypothetical protein
MARGGRVVNWEHLRAFIWLRWRLRVNQNRRAGAVNVWIQRILVALGLVIASVVCIGFFMAGLLLLGTPSPGVLMLVWDGVVVAFIFVWMTELLVELQRSELLAMDKFLHLPVSLNGAFLINYLGSMVSPGVIVLSAGMIGLSAGLLFSRGIAMLALFPLVASFMLAVTSIAYQFRGWLASLMVNKRRRRTIVTIATLTFILIVQLPNILTQSWRFGRRRGGPEVRNNLTLDDAVKAAARVNQVVPFGWLPYGAMTSADGRFLPSVLGVLGLTAIAGVSLRRSYVTTLRLYRGEFASSGPVRKQKPPTVSSSSAALLEKKLPWLSEEASAVTVACLQSLKRAPEARILFVSPVLMLVVFGSMFLRTNANPPELLRPLMATGAIGMILLILSQLAGNQFGFDRSGFRAYVLSPVARRDVLVGKNFALAPIALALTSLGVIIFQVLRPMRIDHFIATLIQTIPTYFVYCIIENFLSMLAPMPVAPGSLKPSKPKGIQILIHIGFFFLFPVALSPVLIPLGVEFLLSSSGRSTWFPAYLIFVLLECAAVAALYPIAVDSQGGILQRREQKILEVVASKSE